MIAVKEDQLRLFTDVLYFMNLLMKHFFVNFYTEIISVIVFES